MTIYERTLFKKILDEGQNIYKISEITDENCLKTNKIDNWAEVFYNIKDGIIKKRYIELVSKTEYNKFFEALNYEYGINGYPLDLDKAFKIYKIAADNSTDSLSMYRLYRIYKIEYLKFRLKRNTLFEKYYLYKSCAYLNSKEISSGFILNDRFNLYDEIIAHIDGEDPNMDLFEKLFKHLKKNHKIYNLKLNELIFIQNVIIYIFCSEDDKEKAKNQLKSLSLQENLEAAYKLICLVQDKSNNKERMELLFRNNYYRSYQEYAIYLNNNSQEKKAKNILKIAINNGYYSFILHYFDIFFQINEFENIMKSEEYRNEFLFILGCMFDYFILDGVYIPFEIIYIRHVCIEHFNIKFDEYFLDYIKGMTNFLINITKGTEDEVKDKIKKYYLNDKYFNELIFACSIIYYYGIKDVLEKNYNESLKNLKIVLKNSKDKNYERFCYSYLYKIKKKLINGNMKEESDKNEQDILEIKNKLYQKYYTGINDEDVSNLSTSFFYYLSKLYKKKIGNNGDPLLEYIFINRATKEYRHEIGNNSFLIYYRNYKAKINFKQINKDKINDQLKDLEKYKYREGYNEDDSLCPICYVKKKTTACLPCKHFYCDSCLKKLEEKKCPLCRKAIVVVFNIKTKKEDFL